MKHLFTFKILFVCIIFLNFLVASNASANVKLLPPKNNEIYFGSFPDFGGSENIVTENRISEFENLSEKNIVWAYFSQNWMDGIVFPEESVNIIHNHGAVPFIRLMPRSNYDTNEPVYTLENIINENFDSDLRKWAQDAKATKIPILIDFAVEMTGDWFSWSGVYHGGGTKDGYGDPNYFDGPEKYRDAYRHIIDIFNQEGAKNITWFFHADITREPNEEWNSAKYYYPGDDYIDWIGVSIYGAQTPKASEDWEMFDDVLSSNYNLITEITSNKPIALLEFGVTDDHPNGDKALWLQNAFDTILSNPYIEFKAISYWHENWENDSPDPDSKLRIDSSQSSLLKFKNLASDSRFISNATFSTDIRIDVNQDSLIDISDVFLILMQSINLDMNMTTWQQSPQTGDVNCDNEVNTIDAQLLLRYLMNFDVNSTNWCAITT